VSDSLRQDADTLRATLAEFFLDAAARGRGDDGIYGRREEALAALSRLVAAAETTPDDGSEQELSESTAVAVDVAEVDEMDDAVHIAAPWDRRISLCGQQNRMNLASLEGDWPNGWEGCWTCLMAAPYVDPQPTDERPKRSSPEVAVGPSVGASERLTAIRERAEGLTGYEWPGYGNAASGFQLLIREDVPWLLGLVDKLTKERDDTGSVISALEGAKRWAARAVAAEAAADTASILLEAHRTEFKEEVARQGLVEFDESPADVLADFEKEVLAAVRARQVLAEPQGTSLGGAADAAPGSGGEA
jgi:hypothetical protein